MLGVDLAQAMERSLIKWARVQTDEKAIELHLDPVDETDRPLEGKRVLLVDDSADTQETFAMLLHVEGAIVF